MPSVTTAAPRPRQRKKATTAALATGSTLVDISALRRAIDDTRDPPLDQIDLAPLLGRRSGLSAADFVVLDALVQSVRDSVVVLAGAIQRPPPAPAPTKAPSRKAPGKQPGKAPPPPAPKAPPARKAARKTG